MKIEIKGTCDCVIVMRVLSIHSGKHTLFCPYCKKFNEFTLTTEEIVSVSIHSGETIKFELPMLKEF